MMTEAKEELFEVRELNRGYWRKRQHCAETLARLNRLSGLAIREAQTDQSEAMFAIQDFQFRMQEKYGRAFDKIPPGMMNAAESKEIAELNANVLEAMREVQRVDDLMAKKHKIGEWQSLLDRYTKKCCVDAKCLPEDVDWEKGTARVKKGDHGMAEIDAELEQELQELAVNPEP